MAGSSCLGLGHELRPLPGDDVVIGWGRRTWRPNDLAQATALGCRSSSGQGDWSHLSSGSTRCCRTPNAVSVCPCKVTLSAAQFGNDR